ncbi:hypothetical protein H105_00375 [Trichophyton soudanense CBS 452.61]|uniref:Peptidase A1 domain-containing protein n=1 Tax=Trichophyton soudanense CBS 452.61 TaxID=1215331 RepID=A0A022Y830_TRISD|nr:hypothetical protein H105_00375 [Trichophyton soudanense CBS 452.61]
MAILPVPFIVRHLTTLPGRNFRADIFRGIEMKGVPTSLTFGGFDRSRFIPNEVSFFLSPGNLPAVTIKSVKVKTGPMSNSNLLAGDLAIDLSSSGTFVIDSSTPFLWFPEQICDSLAGKLGLSYNNTLDLYTYGPNISTYDAIAGSNVSFTFTLSDLPDSSKSVNITLPFAAFDHKLTYPYPGLDQNQSSEGLRYFPLRRTTDPKKLTIGRVFLQEAYLTVDYERRNFSISQATFNPDSGISMDLVAITSPPNSAFPGGHGVTPDRKIPKAAIVGVTIGVCAAVIIVSLIVLLFYRKRRSRELSISEKEENPPRFKFLWKFWRRPVSPSMPAELVADKHHPVEADNAAIRYELPAATPVELPATEISGYRYGHLQKARDLDMEGNEPPPPPLIQYQHITTNPSEQDLVSPIGPGSTFGASELNNSLGIPSPIATSTNSTSLSHKRPDSSPSLLTSCQHAVEPTTTGTSTSAILDSQPQSEPKPDLTRKFSWEK